jgi:cell division protein FtsQ
MTLTSSSRTRFQQRQWQRRLRSLRPFLIALAVIAVLAFACWVVFFSSWLAARDVEVSGAETVSEDQVVHAASVDLGTPLVRLDLDAIQQRIAKLPAVAAVTVHRSWPHTVSIDITERQPVAAVYREGSWWVMDVTGVVFRRTGGRDPDLPVVAVPARLEEAALREVASVVEVLPDDVLGQVRRFTARSMDSITLRLKDKSTVIWGSAAESDRKVEVLGVLLDQVKAAVYDVSVPEQPTTSN